MTTGCTFLPNKYSRWYYAIVESARADPPLEHFEGHHIIPRSLGGTEAADNLVNLTFRQHYACHMLLTKMIADSGDKRKMVFALHMMSIKSKTHTRSTKPYEYTKKLRQQIGVSEETRLKISKGNRGKVLSVETRALISLAKQNLSPEARDNIRAARIGKKHSAETLVKIGNAMRNPSQETRDKMRTSHEGKSPWNKGLSGVQVAWNKGLTYVGKKQSAEHVRKRVEARLKTLEARS